MLEEIQKELSKEIKDVVISNVTYDNNLLSVEIDSDETINIEKCVLITKQINPILDKLNIIKEEYMLEVITKEKGENNG